MLTKDETIESLYQIIVNMNQNFTCLYETCKSLREESDILTAERDRYFQILQNLQPEDEEFKAGVTRHEVLVYIRDHGPITVDNLANDITKGTNKTKDNVKGVLSGLINSGEVILTHGNLILGDSDV
jgi:hypothetical protein